MTDPDETEANIPAGLKNGLKKTNRPQDILKSEMNKGIGKSGNHILKTLAVMREEGFEGSIYSHPIGDWGHSAGTLISMYVARSLARRRMCTLLLDFSFSSCLHFSPRTRA